MIGCADDVTMFVHQEIEKLDEDFAKKLLGLQDSGPPEFGTARIELQKTFWMCLVVNLSYVMSCYLMFIFFNSSFSIFVLSFAVGAVGKPGFV